MEEQTVYLKTSFSYTDEFGQTTTVSSTHDADAQDEDDTYFLMGQFKLFLLACGYSQNWVDKISYVEDDEIVIKKV